MGHDSYQVGMVRNAIQNEHRKTLPFGKRWQWNRFHKRLSVDQKPGQEIGNIDSRLGYWVNEYNFFACLEKLGDPITNATGIKCFALGLSLRGLTMIRNDICGVLFVRDLIVTVKIKRPTGMQNDRIDSFAFEDEFHGLINTTHSVFVMLPFHHKAGHGNLAIHAQQLYSPT